MDLSSLDRKVGNRHQRISAPDPNLIVFSLKYFIDTQPKNEKQSYSSWERDKRLSKLLEILQEICCMWSTKIQKKLSFLGDTLSAGLSRQQGFHLGW